MSPLSRVQGKGIKQLATNLPVGHKQITAHLLRRDEARMPMNVSKEADEAYMNEKGVRLTQVLEAWPVGTCARCSAVINNAPFIKAEAEYCTQACRDGIKGEKRVSKEAERQIDRTQAKWDKIAARRAIKTGNLPTGWIWCARESCHAPFRPARAATVHCSSRCKRLDVRNPLQEAA